MPPRPHLAFRGRFGLRASLRFAGLGDVPPAPGAGPSGSKGAAALGPKPSRDRVILSAIVAGEVAVFLAIVYLVVRRTTDPRQSSWMLLTVFLLLLGLSCLRRRTFPGEPGD